MRKIIGTWVEIKSAHRKKVVKANPVVKRRLSARLETVTDFRLQV